MTLHAVGDQLCRLELGVGVEHDADLHVLFAERAGDGVGGALRHRRMAQHRPLDLEGGDVLAPAADGVLLAVDEEQVPVLVEPAEVAGVEPQVAELGQVASGRLR